MPRQRASRSDGPLCPVLSRCGHPVHYDLVLSTERLDVPTATALVLAAFEAPRVHATPEAQAEVRDRSLLARAQAALLANPVTRDIELFLQCSGGHLSVSGRVSRTRLDSPGGLRRSARPKPPLP